MAGDRDLRRAVRGSGRSMSRQRTAVLQTLRQTTKHPTAADLFDAIREQIPSITLATIYRNLAVLKELGLVIEVDAGGTSTRYDATTQSHSHITCIKCGLVEDLDLDLDTGNGVDVSVEEATGYKLVEHTTTFHGICPRCQSESNTN